MKAGLIVAACLVSVLPRLGAAQTVTSDLTGTWTLVALEREPGTDESERVRGPRGVLILDAQGHVFEFFSAPDADQAGSATVDAQPTLNEFGGFWGRYTPDAAAGRLDFESAAGVSPDVRGIAFSRRFDLDGDVLVLTSGDEPHAQQRKRWTWQRMPVNESLSPYYREVVGFWQHVEERQVERETGEILRSSERAPSVIVYTPSGFVGVHFPALGRDPVADAMPDAESARAALRGYIGYFGTLGVFPGEVSHNILSGVSPGTGSILRRYAAITGDELVVTLQSGALPTGDGPRTVTEVVLRRLSGADDLMP